MNTHGNPDHVLLRLYSGAPFTAILGVLALRPADRAMSGSSSLRVERADSGVAVTTASGRPALTSSLRLPAVTRLIVAPCHDSSHAGFVGAHFALQIN
jgi:hypothetical protein